MRNLFKRFESVFELRSMIKYCIKQYNFLLNKSSLLKETLHLIKDIYNYSYLINEKIKYDNYKREVNSYIMFFFLRLKGNYV